MALVLKDRVKETTTTTGTGSFALAGAVTGYDSFGQIGNGNTTYYAVYLDGGSEWEVGIGTYTAPSTLSRDTILASSNAGSIVTFSAGQKTIWCDYPAGKAVYTDATGSISQTIVNISGITGDIATPDSITFDTTAAEASATGKLFWDDGDGVLSNGLKGGNVTLQIGTQEYARVYNDSGTTLTKGQAVYISGAQGNRVAVKLARADVEATSFGTIGLVAETMANGAEGFIIVSGALYKLNTQGLTAGATVYLSPTTAGAVTTTKPQAPDQLVVIGWVERVDNTVGSIYVKVDNGYELDELHDVQVTSPQSGNLLIYDASTTPIGVWKNANLTDGTGITITEGAGSVTIANSGVTALSAGTGISVSGSTGSVTVTNTAPDQVVALTGTGTTTITGAYPNFTINSDDQFDGTVTSVDLTAGTGISVSGGPITSSGSITVTNTAPDQTVSLTGAGTTTISGTYPNFTITSNDQYTGTVTAVTGTAPIASSGGNTPAISISQATSSTDGYLSSTDWNTFNNKQPAGTYVTSVGATSPVTSTGGTTPTIAMPAANGSTNGYLTSTDWTTFNSKGNGTVTSVGGTGTVNGITLTGTVTSSGNLTLGGTLSGVNLATQVTGTLPIANGGTGQTTANAAYNALSPMTTTGDITYEAAGGIATRLPIGTSGQVLSVSGGIPAWTTPSTGASVTVGTSPPVSPNAGDFWWDSESGKLKIYYNDGTSSQWVDAATGTVGGGSSGGVQMVSGGGGFSTTSTTMVDVPNLTAALTEGTWAYVVDLSFQSSGTAGSRFCMTYTGSFSSIEYTQSAMESATADGATTRQTTSGSTSGTSYGATSSVPLYGRMFGNIVVTGAGNLKVQISKTTSGTATTYPSVMTYYRVA